MSRQEPLTVQEQPGQNPLMPQSATGWMWTLSILNYGRLAKEGALYRAHFSDGCLQKAHPFEEKARFNYVN